MVRRLTGAGLRAALVVLVILLPSLLLPATTAETSPIVALVAVIAAIFTFVEYYSDYPSLVEFRDAPPFNRIRFLALLATVWVLSLVVAGHQSLGSGPPAVMAMGAAMAELLDFPYSPVRLMRLVLPADAPADLVDLVRTTAGLAYLISLVALAWFILQMRLSGWPVRREGFNVWTNLPTFDPTAGGNVADRLSRDSQINLILGFLLPFLIPAAVKLASDLFDPIRLTDPHTLIWTMTAWAFLPASLVMRGTALARVVRLIEAQRKRRASQHTGKAQHV